MRIYVAGSSEQLDRVEAVMVALEQAGHTISHDWVTEVRKVGSANPVDASLYARMKWAREDLAGVHQADVLLLLMPSEGGFGAAVELGYAIANSIPILVSGAANRSIFTAFAQQVFAHDGKALEYFGASTTDS